MGEKSTWATKTDRQTKDKSFWILRHQFLCGEHCMVSYLDQTRAYQVNFATKETLLRKRSSDVSREYGLGRAQGLASWTRPCPNQNSKPWSYKIGFGTFSSSQSLQYLVSLRYSLCEWCLSLLVMVLTADNSLDNRDNCGKGDVDDEQIGELSCAVKLVLIGIMAALSIIITVRAAQK